MSIPWSPPEVFRPITEPDERCDVYSLGATVWHLLVGHSPFEVVGGDNRPLPMMNRIERDPIPRTGREDVPVSLERLLQQAMGKKPENRFDSAFDFARALQAVQQEMQLSLTPIEIPDTDDPDSHPRHELHGGEGEETRFRPKTVEAQRPPITLPSLESTTHRPGNVSIPTAQPALLDPQPARQRVGVPVEPPVEKTVGRPLARPIAAGHEADHVVPPSPRPGRRTALVVAVGVVVLAVGASLLVSTFGRQKRTPGRTSPSGRSATPQDVTGGAFVPPVQASAKRLSPTSVRFDWQQPNPQAGDFFVVTRTDKGAGPRPVNVKQSTASYELVGAGAGTLPCLSIVAVRGNGRASEPTSVCADA